jgi:hypothetical protein
LDFDLFSDFIDGATFRREWFLTSYTPLPPELEMEIFHSTEWLYPENLEWDKFLDSDFGV